MSRTFDRLRSRLRRLLPALLCLGLTGTAAGADLTVSAASSLTDAFKDVARAYEARHPGDRVRLNLAASGVLLRQIAQGAPVDVFASADQETMDRAAEQGLLAAGSRRDFAGNALVLVQPADAGPALGGLDDLRASEVVRIAVGQPATVPVGRYAQQALETAGLWRALAPKLVFTQNVRQSLDYAVRGEVEAAFVYATDAAVEPDRLRRAFEVPLATGIRYPAAALAGSAAPDAARRFVDFLLGEEAQAILQRHGFRQP